MIMSKIMNNRRISVTFLPRLLGLILSISSLTACAPVNQASAQKQNSINHPDHKKIIRAFGGVYEDFKVGSYVAGLSLKIAKSSDDPESTYRVTVLDSPQVNAFAMPGGYTYVTRGLLALANNEAEVAAVMGHEIAHVTAAHGNERQRTSIGAAVLATVLGNVLNSRIANQIIDISATGLMASYSRKQEYEADRLGVQSLYRAGYDPYAGGDFLAAMGRLSEREARLSGGNSVPGWFSTHPDTGDRVSKAHKIAEGLVVNSNWRRNHGRATHLEAIDGMLYGDAPDEGFIRGQDFLHPLLRFSFSVPDSFKLINSSQAVFAKGPEGAIIKFDMADADQSTNAYLTDIWAEGLSLRDINEINSNLDGATAIHEQSGKISRLVVLQAGERKVYRFVMQSPSYAFEGLDGGFKATARDFKKLTIAEAGKLRPLKIKILTVREDDRVQNFVKQIKGVETPEEMFRILNGLGASEDLVSGTKVKIITDSQVF